ncbi:FCD domain-containing protein [Roseicyclus sp. F158]|uniref:FCD domain-containing protein n=1 Tax=Tropicimonas omnivorans TaxID=3075590 RepID=A0ABU3DLV4_9RHOB|nr:FCD domain-containing protein [Roseicyclus sp. F158]MDT0684568.1 FCD domain-containing protein [Roseicyclus sp. F158]
MSAPQAEPPEKTNAERAYRRIRDDIVAGALSPSEKMKIEMLRGRYGFGAAPLREALARLSGDHLVELQGQRGFIVAPISAKDAEEIGDLRKLLEVEALRQSIPAGDVAWEERLITTYHRLERLERDRTPSEADLYQWEIRNTEFHDATVAACTSGWLLRMRQHMYRQHERYRRFSRKSTARKRDIHDEHRALFDAAIERDVDEAIRIISSHVQRTTDTVIAGM